MRVGILIFNVKNGGYGGAQGPASAMWDILHELSLRGERIEHDLLLASGNGSPNKSWIRFDHPIRVVRYADYLDALNSYDYLIMTTPGPAKASKEKESWAFNAIMRTDTPFVMRFCGEGDWPALYPSMKEYMKSTSFDGWIVTNPVMKDFYKDDTFIVNAFNRVYDDGRMFECEPLLRRRHLLDNPDIERIIEEKKPSIVSPHRWVGFKKIKELVDASPALTSMGLEVLLYGHSPFFHFCEAIRATHPTHWKEMGQYDAGEVDGILSPHRYLWNASAHWKHKSSIPRFDYTVYEGIWNGCIPLLSDKMCPDWYRGEHEILLEVTSGKDKSERYTNQIIEWIELLEQTDTQQLAYDTYKHMRENITLDKLCDLFVRLIR